MLRRAFGLPWLKLSLLLSCLVLASLCFAPNNDWPGFRGLSAQGRNPDAGVPLRWSQTTKVVWRTPIGGSGHSSPIVSGDSVYVTRARLASSNPAVVTASEAALAALLAALLSALGWRLGSTKRGRFALDTTATVLAALIAALVLCGSSALNFGRAPERPWLAACLGGLLCFGLSGLGPSKTGAGKAIAGTAMVLLAIVLAFAIPDKPHTLGADPASAVSVMIYLVIALPAVLGLWMLGPLGGVSQRTAGKLLKLAAHVSILASVFLLVLLLRKVGGSTDGSISVGERLEPPFGWALLVVPFAASGAFAVLLRFKRAESWIGAGFVLSWSAGLLLTLVLLAIALLASQPYLWYLAHAPEVRPILDPRIPIGLSAVFCVALLASLLMRRHSIEAERPLHPFFRAAAAALGLAYVVTVLGVAKDPVLVREIVCVNRESGQMKWVSQGLIGPQGTMHSDNSPATPTPVTDGARVFGYFGATGVICVDRQGKTLWTYTNLPFQSREGVASSPILCQGRLVVLSESDAGTYLAGIEASSGRLAWRTERGKKTHSYAGNCRTPIFAEVRAAPTIVVWGCEDLSGYDPANGRELWSHAVPDVNAGENPVACPVIDGSRVYLLGLYRSICLDLGSGPESSIRTVWDRECEAGAQCSTPVLSNGLLFAVSDIGSAYCLSAVSGKEIWRHEFEGQHYASAVLAGDRVLLTNTRGRTKSIAASPEFRLLATSDLNEPTFASVAPVGGDLYVRTAQALYRISDTEKR